MLTISEQTNKNVQTMMLKSMVLDLGWFDGNRAKFEDWSRRIRLFLKSDYGDQ